MWQGQKVILRGDGSVLVEAVRFKELNGLLNNTRLVFEINLYMLRFIED
jgi:hypothetical protein